MKDNQAEKDSSPFLKTRYPFLRRYRGNNVFYLWFKHKGKRYQKSLETTVESVAKIKAEDEIKAIKNAATCEVAVANGKISFGDLLDRLEQTERRRMEAKEIKLGTFNSIMDGLIRVRRDCAEWLEREASKISFKELDDYCHSIKVKESPTTVNRVVDTFKHAYAMGVEERLVLMDPTIKIKRASLHNVKSDEIPTEEQYQRLLQYFRDCKLSHKYHVIDTIEFLTAFGPRIQEARNTLKSDVDLANGTLAFRHTKNGKVRLVPIFDDARPLVERLLGRKNLRIYGKEVRSDKLLGIGKCYGAIRSAVKALGLPFKITHHTFRHLCAQRWIEDGVNIKQVSKWLGHQDGGRVALSIYTNARDEQDKAEAAKVGRNRKPKEESVQTNLAHQETEAVVINGVTYSKAELAALLPANKIIPMPKAATA